MPVARTIAHTFEAFNRLCWQGLSIIGKPAKSQGDWRVTASTAHAGTTHLIRAKDREQWNAAVAAAPRSDMLQGWEWGEFREDLGGWKPYRFLLLRDDTPVAGVQVLVRRVKGVPFLYAPRGPWWRAEADLESLIREARRLTSPRGPFLRIDPLIAASEAPLLERLGFHRAPQQVQPRATIVVDLARSPEEILAGYDRQVRYNARLAEKKGVEVVEGGAELVGDFWKLLNTTAGRKGFVERGADYYERFIEHFRENARVFLARYNGGYLYGAVIAVFGPTAYYLYGASGGDRSVKPSELTQYKAMLWAKSRGATRYDMWGIPTQPTEGHPLYGTYRFKSGFGGATELYAGAFDLPLIPVLGSAATAVESLALKSRALARGQGWRIIDHLA
jgi:lipid II:glycine glycyltransferase (peptidoglycan interpeptide bridge formation enzyme)